MSNTETSARPIVVIAVTASALLLLVALFVSSWWIFVAGVAAVVANVLIAVKFPDTRKASSAGAIIAAIACVVPPILG